MKHRFKSAWRDAAVRRIDRDGIGKFRYVIGKSATREQLIDAAMSVYRLSLDGAYGHAIRHPRSKKAMDDVLTYSRELARLGRYALELNHGT